MILTWYRIVGKRKEEFHLGTAFHDPSARSMFSGNLGNGDRTECTEFDECGLLGTTVSSVLV